VPELFGLVYCLVFSVREILFRYVSPKFSDKNENCCNKWERIKPELNKYFCAQHSLTYCWKKVNQN
jgi:hypothetical protein